MHNLEPAALAAPGSSQVVALLAQPRVAGHRRASSSSGPDFVNLDTQGWLDYLLADLPASTTPAVARKSGAGSAAFSIFSEGWDDDSQNFMINAAFGEQQNKALTTDCSILIAHLRDAKVRIFLTCKSTGSVSTDRRVTPSA